jgi:tetratricopeptide (TPR) repeat protein
LLVGQQLLPARANYLGDLPGRAPQRQPEALRELRLAVQLDPDSPLAHHYLATALFNGEDFAAAETEFRQTLRLQPTANNHFSLSACLMSLGRYDDALTELDKATRLGPAQNLYRARKQELLRLRKASNGR